MPGGAGGRYDFFVSRRGSVSTVAQEVADVLIDKGYAVIVQDYDIPFTANFIEAMHEAIKNSRDLVVLFTRDYEESPHTRNEFTSFQADAAQSAEPRRIVILRCEDVPLRGHFAPIVYQDLVGIDDPQERKRRIIAAAKGHSQGFRPPPRPFVGVPPRVANFTGRADALDRLDAILMGDKKPGAITQASVGRAAGQGVGGVGKTSLAFEYAHRFRDLYAGVWWCPAETRVGLLASLAGLGGELDPALKNEADVERAAQAALRRLAEQRAIWLLAYDNVTGPEAIADLLPSAGARVLITSRFSDFASWAEEVALDVLPLGEATGFLQSHTSRTDAAGATILAEAPSAPRGAAYPRSVAATFDLAIAEAVANCPAAEGLMTYLAHCAPERIPMALLEDAIADEDKRVEALAALAEVSLLRHDPFEDGTLAVTVHRRVQTVARARAQAKGEAKASIELLMGRLAAIYPDDAYINPTSWPLCAQLTPHLLALREAAPDGVAKSAGWPELLNGAGLFFHRRGAYGQAEPLFREALAIREKALGAELFESAESLNKLASLLHAQGDLAEARPLFERALAINEKALGPEHPETADSLNNLASLLHAQGDLAGARPLFERAPAIREKMLASEHPNGHDPQRARPPASGPGRLFRGAAALRARAGDLRKGARPRASLCGHEPQRARQAASGPRRLFRGAAAL
jgi:tetratricopeptide (TPR) repeat protein